jgi:hypothetical protein
MDDFPKCSRPYYIQHYVNRLLSRDYPGISVEWKKNKSNVTYKDPKNRTITIYANGNILIQPTTEEGVTLQNDIREMTIESLQASSEPYIEEISLKTRVEVLEAEVKRLKSSMKE